MERQRHHTFSAVAIRLSPFWRLQLAGWAAFYVAMSFSRVGRFPLAYMLAEKGALTLLGIGASLVLRAVLRPMLARQAPLATVIAVCAAAGYAIAAVWTAAFNLAARPIAATMLDRTYEITLVGALLSGTVYHAFALVAWGFLYVGIKHYAAWQEARDRALRAEALVAEARLAALQSQLNPHFLFNTLNGISTLVAEERNDQASEMIARLAELLRASLRSPGDAMVRFAEELELAQRYLAIERVRFEDRLRLTLDIAEEAYDARVPVLILQPLVENAVRHGVAQLGEGGEIALTARVIHDDDGQWLDVEVVNAAPAPQGTRSAGVGLANVRERLQMSYGARQRFIVERHDERFVVSFRLPFAADQAHARRPGAA